jgi:hypothetical protein
MKIKSIIIGSLVLGLAVGAGLLVNTQSERTVYTPRVNNVLQSNQGRADYMHMLRADPTTGLVDPSLVNQARNEVKKRSKFNNKASIGLNWESQGPDNVGGRTRALLIDQNNSNILVAGSVTGGLFVSTDASLTWTPVAGMQGLLGENLTVSCITQTDNGRIFFGTGCTFESTGGNGGSGALGNGIYEYVMSTGAVVPVITNNTAVPNNSSSSFWSATNAIASYGNRLYLGTRDGMVWADPDGSGAYPTTFNAWTNPIFTNGTVLETNTVQDIDIASDGSMLVCFGGKVYTSNQSDAPGSFTKTSISGSRLSGAVAPSNPNVMYVLGSSTVLAGLSISTDKGASWDVIVPPGVSTGTPSNKDPFVQNDGTGGQGGYDDAIAVNPGNWGHVIVGGVQLYEWKYNAGSNPIGGSWLRSASLFESAQNPTYVHADKQTIVWESPTTVYVGSDGGVAKSENAGQTWQSRNYGYNVTSFYDANIAANGWILGGAQDNGSQLVSFGAFGEITPFGSVEILPGDGFDVAFSNFGTGISYATSQFGNVNRSSGGSGGSFYDNNIAGIVASNLQPFHTVIENWENKYDFTSIDSISIAFDTATGTQISPPVFDETGNVIVVPAKVVKAGETIFAGDTIHYVSATNNLPLEYIVPADIVLNSPVDTIKLQDPIQNKFVIRLTSSDPTDRGIYLTQDAARLGVNPAWFKIAPYSNIENFEFSPSGNDVFLGSSNGKIYRVSGLSTVTSKDDQATWDANLTVTEIATGLGGVVSMAVDPNNGNNVIATSGGYTAGNHVYRATDALTATTNTGTFTAIQGTGSNALPKMPVYDAEVDYSDKDKVIIGTEWGVWTSDNAFSGATGSAVQWTDESGNGMSHVPVFAVEQQRLNSWESVNSGVVYLGTHGRGFYKATDLQVVSVRENDFDEIADGSGFVSDVNVYPNPMNESGTISFKLRENVETTIKIYSLTGSLVKEIQLGMTTKGEHKERFDVSTLSIGSYVISLESNNEIKVNKFIVTR